jgi:predicted transcriptional regulator
MRTLIDLPDEDIERLDKLARFHNRSRAAEVREAVRMYLRGRSGNDWIRRGAGYWRDRTDIGDGVEYQRRLREDRG